METRLQNLKLLEKIVAGSLLVLGVCCYKFKEISNSLFVDNGFVTLPLILFLVGLIRMSSSYYSDSVSRSQQYLRDLKSNEKEEKRYLISKIDPVVVETLREIVM